MYRIYEVQMGDTLTSIASKLGISPEVLANLNGVSINTVLNPNSFIVVPKGTGLFDKYKVQKGDSVYEIAGVYNINPSQLLKLNGLNENDIIYPEQEILIPKANVGFYVTEEADTIGSVAGKLNLAAEDVVGQNRTIYLMPDQLIVYKK